MNQARKKSSAEPLVESAACAGTIRIPKGCRPKQSRSTFCRLLLWATCMFFVGSAYSLGILVPRPPEAAPIEPRDAQIQIQIKNDLSVTRIHQTFYNPNPTRQEADFYFPVPRGANVTDFVLYMEGKPVRGEILEREKARDIYEQIVRRMRDPGLLEWMDSDIFRVRVFPVPPRDTQKIEIEFSAPLQAHQGTYRYRLPLRAPSRSGKGHKTAEGRLTEFRVELTSQREFGTVYSPSHEMKITRESGQRVLVEPTDKTRFDANPTFELFYDYREKDLSISLLATRREGEPGFFCALLAPPTDQHKSTSQPLDLTLIIDTSGSMAEKGKIEHAKRALNYCLSQLRPWDRFQLIRFATDVEEYGDGLQPATPASLEKAKEWVAALTARGGTNIAAALERALTPKSSSTSGTLHIVIFVTDGLPTVGETNPDRILELVDRLRDQATPKVDQTSESRRSERLRIFTFGVGHDVNTRLLDRIAERTRAASEYVQPEQDLEVPISALFDRASRPAVTNLKVSFTPDVAFDLYPKVLPDLFYGDQLTIFGRYKQGGAVLITVRGEMAGKPVEYTFERSFPESSDENPFVEKLWATRKIGYLLDELRERGENAEIRDEIVALSKKYGIVTPLTSFLVAEDVPVVESRGTERHDVPPNRPSGSVKRSLLPESSVGLAPSQLGARAAAPAARFAESGAEAVDQAVALKSLKGRMTLPSTASEEMRVLRGKTFVLRNGTWRDLDIESRRDLPRVEVQPFSEAYFELLRHHPEWAEWLSLGERVEVVISERVLLSVTPEGKTALSPEDRKLLGI